MNTSQADRTDDPHDQSPAEQPKPLDETMDRFGDTAAKPPVKPAGSPSAVQAWIGRRLNRYEIREVLGTGGMGIVYKAFDSLIEREVAIKILPAELSADEISLQRFLAEAKGAGRLSHPNAVAIYEIGRSEGICYLVLEYVSGGTISDQLERGPLSPLEATRIIADACRGLVAAYAAGIVHRDIKPANLLRAADGSVKVADFGLAKPTIDVTNQLTQTGHVVGTPFFMSPEQCESRPVDHRSDIYSLGATYYSLLTGQNPYEHIGSIVQVMFAHCNSEIPDPRKVRPEVPLACAQIVGRAMAKKPEDRYQTAAEMLADLEIVIKALEAGEASKLPIAAARRARGRLLRVGLLAGIMVLLAGVAGFWMYRDRGGPLAGAVAPAGVAPAAMPTGEPIQVGVLHSLTGTMAESESAVVEATLLAIDEVNQAGGVLGRPIKPLVRDGQSDPQAFAERARTLLLDDKVETVFGCWTSASRKTVVPLFERYNRLLVYPVQYEGLEESPNVIYLGATPNQQIIPALRWAFAFQGKRRFYLIGSDYVFPRAAGAIIRDVIAELGGELVGEEYIPLGSFDIKAAVQNVISARPDMILNTINGDSNIAFFQELRALGVSPEKISTISFSVGEEELRHLNVPHMVGDFAAWSYFQSIDSAENRQFVDKFKAKYGPQRVLTDPMESAYVGVKLWAQAVARSKSIEAAKVRSALLAERLAAPEGPIRFDVPTHHAFKTPRIGRIGADGQFEVVWTDVKPQPPVPFPTSRTREQWNAFLEDLYKGWGGRWSGPAE